MQNSSHKKLLKSNEPKEKLQEKPAGKNKPYPPTPLCLHAFVRKKIANKRAINRKQEHLYQSKRLKKPLGQKHRLWDHVNDQNQNNED
jgi:hypothetical protein